MRLRNVYFKFGQLDIDYVTFRGTSIKDLKKAILEECKHVKEISTLRGYSELTIFQNSYETDHLDNTEDVPRNSSQGLEHVDVKMYDVRPPGF